MDTVRFARHLLPLPRTIVAAPAILALLFAGSEPLAAGPVTVDFSYTFGDGQTVSGTVDGDLQPDGDLVTNLTNLHAVYSAVPGSPFTFLGNNPPSNRDLSLSASQLFDFFGFVSFPDTPPQPQKNFGFFLTDDQSVGNSATIGDFSTEDETYFFPPLEPPADELEKFNPDRWTASLEQASPSVPEPASFILVGMGALSVAASHRLWRRRATERKGV